MLLGTLGACLLGNLLTGIGGIAKRQGRGIVRAGYGIKRAGNGLKKIDSTSSFNKFWNLEISWK